MAVISERFDDLGADGTPAKLGLMGGTFDPIHIGHLILADQVRDKLGLDAVLFIPTGNPVFKKDQLVTDAALRLEMCRQSVLDSPWCDVTSVEVDREGDTFTVDTLRQLRAHYPDNVEFYFITGSDAAASLWKWRGTTEMAQLTHLVVAMRPGYFLTDEERASILSAGDFDVSYVDVPLIGVSSREVRQAVREGGSIRYLVPDAVYRTIRSYNLYARDGATESETQDCSDALSPEFFEARKAEVQQRVSAKRFAHILGVSDTCAKLAERYGYDVATARLAGLLHDWDKGYDDEGARNRVRELHMEEDIDPWIVKHMPQVLHGPTAACALKRAFPQIPAEVIRAIDVHTTAEERMGVLDKILYIADAIEPNRQFGKIDELRALAEHATLDELYFATYEYWVFLLFERRKPLHPDTIRIWNAYTEQRLAMKGRKRG